MEYPKRIQIRLKDYDYSQNGTYFVTVCTRDRRSVLSRPVGAIHESPECPKASLELSAYGFIVNKIICEIPERFNVEIDNYVIMPDHIHLMISINDQSERAIRESPLQRSLLSKIIGYLKMNASKQIRLIYGDQNIWQRSFVDHVIRNKEDYEKHWTYIENNPLKLLLQETSP